MPSDVLPVTATHSNSHSLAVSTVPNPLPRRRIAGPSSRKGVAFCAASRQPLYEISTTMNSNLPPLLLSSPMSPGDPAVLNFSIT